MAALGTSGIDESLLRQFIQNEPGAMQAIFRVYHQRIFAYSLKITRSSDEAEEITQLVFIRLWERRHQIDPTRPFGPYIYTIARNLAFNHLKQEAYRAQYERSEEEAALVGGDSVSDEVLFRECRQLTTRLIDALPEKRQLIFKMHTEEGYDVAEIAGRLNLSLHTVKSQLQKATKAIRNQLLRRQLLHWVSLLLAFLRPF
jgi:RNA polymerase sigma-70 factor (ECF subfamily)